VDNATSFSPPSSPVRVRGNVVGKGVVVEIEDQGLGIEFEERDRLNQTLREPLDFQAMAAAGQRHLGLFVVGHLAQRHGIRVSLLESAYGGVKAIVLIPADLVEADAASGGLAALRRAGEDEHAPAVLPEIAEDLVPRPSRSIETTLPGQQVRKQPVDPVPPSQPRRDPGALVSAPWPELAADGRPGPPVRTRAALPRRERLAHLAPMLRPEADGASTPRRSQRSPEEARDSMSAFQRGTRSARHSPDHDNA
jgi:hypothetical protein